MRGTIHHIDLTVSDLMVSAAFYETVLGFLGYRRTSTRPDYVDWNLPGGDGLLCSIGLKAARSDRQHDRYSVGLHYLAWHAVDRVFFADPDGLKLELSITPANREGLGAVRF